MALRPCAGCGVTLVLRGYCDKPKCQAKQPKKLAEQHRTRTRDSRVKGWYDSARWRSARLGFLRQNPLCEGLRLVPDGPVVINTHAGRIAAANEVDHIVPHKGDFGKFWDRRNWQGGCKECHSVKTAREDGGFGHVTSAVTVRESVVEVEG